MDHKVYIKEELIKEEKPDGDFSNEDDESSRTEVMSELGIDIKSELLQLNSVDEDVLRLRRDDIGPNSSSDKGLGDVWTWGLGSRLRIRINPDEGIVKEVIDDDLYKQLPQTGVSDAEDTDEEAGSLNYRPTLPAAVAEEGQDTDGSSSDPIHVPSEDPGGGSPVGDDDDPANGEACWSRSEPASVPSECFQLPCIIKTSQLYTPYQYFKYFFDDQLMDHITDQTNLYCVQEKLAGRHDCDPINTDKNEIEQFIGVLLYMGIYPSPQYKTYWNLSTHLPQITQTLKGGMKRFEDITKFLHFNDNSKAFGSGYDGYHDQLFKIRPVITSIRDKCLQLDPEEYNVIDEATIPSTFSSPEQESPKNQRKRGYKVFTRCGASGILYNFEISSNPHSPPQVSSSTGFLVTRLCRNIPEKRNYKVCFDTYFSSLWILRTLNTRGILGLCTIRPEGMEGAQGLLLTSERGLKKSQGRGSFDWRTDLTSNITVVRWLDNCPVQLASTYIGPEEGDVVKRWSGRGGNSAAVEIRCPRMAREYSRIMAGTDSCHRLLSLYRIRLKARKWYMPIFYYLIKVAVTNGWLLYRRQQQQQQHADLYHPDDATKNFPTLFEFQESVANDLILAAAGKPTTFRTSPPPPPPPSKKSKTSAAVAIPADDFRYDCVGHFPNFSDKKHRCRSCPNGYTYVYCVKCNVFLCLIKNRNCFLRFHKKK